MREPTAAVLQWLINLRRPNEGLQLAEERILPDEEESLQSIITSFAGYMMRTYPPGRYERGGNTKTHGVVKAEVRDPRRAAGRICATGVFAEPRTFQAYVRFSGPGPNLPDDIRDVGFSSMAVKLMGVPGPKLMPDEQHTQDLIAVCTPDLRHAQHARERQAAALELPRPADLLLPQSRSTRTSSTS